MKKRMHAIERFAEMKYAAGRAKVVRAGGKLTVFLHYTGAYGMGERFDAFNQKGRTVANRVEEKFCFQGDKTYCPAPFFWTDTGFGLYADTCDETTFRFGEDTIEILLPQRAEVVLFSGTPEQMVREYMGLFGPAVLPPEWVFGPWISANRWSTQAQAEEQLALLRRYDYPASVLVLEAWSDEATFYIWNGAKYRPRPDGQALRAEDFDFSDSPWPNPRGMLDTLRAAGLHLLLWQVPVYKKQGIEETQNTQNDLDRADAAARRLCVLNGDGTPYVIPTGHWFAGSMVPDFTNPQTGKSWFAKRQYLLDMGVDGFKTDGGEFIYSDDARFFDGSTGVQQRSRYSRDYEESYTRFIGQGRALFSRAGYAGQHTVPSTGRGISSPKTGSFAACCGRGSAPPLRGSCSGALTSEASPGRCPRWISTGGPPRWPASAPSCSGIPSRMAVSFGS